MLLSQLKITAVQQMQNEKFMSVSNKLCFTKKHIFIGIDCQRFPSPGKGSSSFARECEGNKVGRTH